MIWTPDAMLRLWWLLWFGPILPSPRRKGDE